MEVSVAIRVGKECRFLQANGRLSKRRPCARPIWTRAKTVRFDTAKAKTTWRFARSVRLRPGRYNAVVRAVDRDGNTEIKKRRTNRARFKIR